MDLAWDYFKAGFAAGAEADQDAEEKDFASDPLAERVSCLSPRRFEVLQLVARGLTNREIGKALGISSYTVKSHLAGLFESLEVTNRTEAAFALQRYDEVDREGRSN
jgi:DNA-binding NarL/FixJ family response regulator